MVLSVEECGIHVRHALNGAELSDGLNLVDLVNLTGRWLVAAHEWKWLEGVMVKPDLVAGEDYITLPTDFRSIIDIDTANLSSGVSQASLGRLVELRKNSAGSSNYYEGAIEWDHTVTPPVARFAVWPDIEVSSTDALLLFYRRDWKLVEDDNSFVHIPGFMEPLFIEALRAYARGWEDDDEADVNMRLSTLKLGEVWAAARKVDAQVQPSYGVLENGMAETAGWNWADRWRYTAADGPT
ncbi:MAG: hypothetical protein JSV86_12825 [Gemmatimonadota bacterium]|nr:MAG: hypothetical protein JSV86_12825 [Gemmatimonadota bacterium]